MYKIKSNLQKDEIPILVVRKHWIIFLPAIVSGLIEIPFLLNAAPIPIILLPAILFALAIREHFSTGFIMSNKNVIGLCEGKLFTIPLKKIESIVIHETSLGKYLNYATLVISSPSHSYTLKKIVKSDFLNQSVIDSLNSHTPKNS